MELIDFPITGNLRQGDILRTVYLDRDECAVRNTASAEGQNLFEIALNDYEPGCKQEVWNIQGSGAFIHRDWRDGISLPNLIIIYDETSGKKTYMLTTQDGSRVDEINDGREREIFNKLLKSSHYNPMSIEDYRVWVEDYKRWNKRNAD